MEAKQAAVGASYPVGSGFDSGELPGLLLSTTPGGPSTHLQTHAQPQWLGPGMLEGRHQVAWAQLQDAGMPQMQPQGSWLQPSISSGSAGGVSAGAGNGGSGRLDPAAMAAKLSTAREKNRLAQQRFRERQREKQKAAGEQCEVLQEQIEELEGENERLQHQNRIYEKVLAVRDAMLQTFTSLHPPNRQRWQQQVPPMSAAAQGLAKAINDLPSEGEIDAAAPIQQQQQQQPMSQGSAEKQAGQVTSHSSDSGASMDAVQNVQWSLANPHRLGVSAQLDGIALREVEIIPPASDQAVVARVETMTEPEHLLDYYRQWQAELSMCYTAAKVAGFDEASVAEVETVVDRMTQIWWHVGEMKPAYLCYLAHAALPEDSAQFPLWQEIAAEVLPQMDEMQRAILRRSWHKYSKRLAKIAVGVLRWVKRLHEYVVLPAEGMSTNANRLLELVEITTGMAAAVQEEYIASMEFVAEQAHATTTIQKAFMNHASAPFLPDVVAIDYNILLLDSQQRRARAVTAAQPGLLPTTPSSGPAPSVVNVANAAVGT